MCTSFCPKCGGDFLNDGPVCLGCIRKTESADFDKYVAAILSAPDDESDEDTISRLNKLFELVDEPLPRGDDDGQPFIPATAEELAASAARIEASGPATW
jgi:hypothetical protein